MTLGNIFSLLSSSGILNSTQQSQGTQQPQGGQDSLAGEAMNLLGSFLGGGQQQGAVASSQNTSNNLLDMVTNVMQSPAASSYIQPIVNQVAAKVGIPPETALSVVTAAVHYLATNHGTKIANGEDMSGLLQQHSNANFVQSNNIAQQVANKTGLDSKTAATAMSEVFKLLGQK